MLQTWSVSEFLTRIQTPMYFRELIGKARSKCQYHMSSTYSDSTVMSLSVSPGEFRCWDCHNPLCFILSTGECRPSQLSEARHARHDDRVPTSLLFNPAFPIRFDSSSTGMYLNEKFSWRSLVISNSVFFSNPMLRRCKYLFRFSIVVKSMFHTCR